MLLSFRFANHRSFRDEQQLNLTPIYHPEHSAPPAVPVVGIFGANASGKSNALSAFSFMRRFALLSDREVEPNQDLTPTRDAFRLDSVSRNSASRYVVDLMVRDVRYTYGFSIDNDGVLEEWLHSYHKSDAYPIEGRKRVVFERTRDEIEPGRETRNRSELKKIAEITAPTALFLSTVARFGKPDSAASDRHDEPLHEVYGWFRNIYERASAARGSLNRPTRPEQIWAELGDDRGVVVGLLRAADVGITDVTLNRADGQMVLFDDSQAALLGDLELQDGLNSRRGRASRQRYVLQFAHRGDQGDFLLDFSDESAGTRLLLELAVDIAAFLRRGGIIIIDEIDASLHPMLTARLIRLFQSPSTNRLSSQLIFTSHDATLLGNFELEEVLGRDQIWFADKDEDGSSYLYPLSDFKPRKGGENREKRYLNGSYGAVPDLAHDVFEQALLMRGETSGKVPS